MSIYKKLAEAKKEIGKISKDSTNPFFKSKYFDINSLLEHVEPILEKHGLLVIQPIEKGLVVTTIIDTDSTSKEVQGVSSSLPLPELNDPQKLGSAITYYRRYTLQSLLALQAEDDDGNHASNNAPKKDEKELPWLNVTRPDKKTPTPQWHNVLQAIADGKIKSLKDVRGVYKVSKATEQEIIEALNQG